MVSKAHDLILVGLALEKAQPCAVVQALLVAHRVRHNGLSGAQIFLCLEWHVTE